MAKEVLEKLEGKFEYSVDKAAKVLYVWASGTYNEEETMKAFQAYSNVVAQINPAEYTVELRFGDIDYVDDDRADVIIQTFTLYLNSGFPKVLLEKNKSITTQSQLEDAIEDSGLAVEFI